MPRPPRHRPGASIAEDAVLAFQALALDHLADRATVAALHAACLGPRGWGDGAVAFPGDIEEALIARPMRVPA